MKSKARAKVLRLSMFSIPLLLLVWELLARQEVISPAFFPPPTRIGYTIGALIEGGKLLPATWVTIRRFGLGLIAGSLLGAALGFAMGWWPRVYDFFDPLIAAFYPIPKIAVFPLLMIVFGIGEGSKFVAILLAAFFPMLITSLAGVRQISRVYFEVGSNYGAKGFNVFRHILFPGSLPSLLTGLRLAANTAFIISISVEIISASQGLGVLLWFGWQTFRVADIYAVLVVISVVGIVFNFLLERLSAWITPWAGQ